MQKAIESFEQDFARWSLHLPETDVAGRRSGTMQAAGWHVLYDFGRDSRGEFLNYYAALRDAADDAVTDDWHVRLYDSGERVPLPTVLEAYMYARDPTPEELVRARRHLAESASATNDAPATATPTAAAARVTSPKSTTQIPPLQPVVHPLRAPQRVASPAPATTGAGASLATPRQATATRTASATAPRRASQETTSGAGASPSSDVALEVGLDLALADIEPVPGGDRLAAWMVTPTGVPTVKPRVEMPAAKPILTVRITAPKLVPIRPAAPKPATPPFTAASNAVASPSIASSPVAPAVGPAGASAVAPGTAAPRRFVPRPAVPTPITSVPVVTAAALEAPVTPPPVVKAPVVEAPVVEAPVVEAPALVVEQAVVNAPVVNAPVVEAPAIEALIAEEPVITTPAVEELLIDASIVNAAIVELLDIDEHLIDEPVAMVDPTAGVADLGLVTLHDDDAPSSMLRTGDASATHDDAADLVSADLTPLGDDALLVLEAESVSIESHVADILPDHAAPDKAPAPELVFLADTPVASIEPAAHTETITTGDDEQSHGDDLPPLLAMLTPTDETPGSADHVITGPGEWTANVASEAAAEPPPIPKRRSLTPDGVLNTTDMAVVAGSFDPWWYRPAARRLATIAAAAAALIIAGSAVAHHRARSAAADSDARATSSAAAPGARSSSAAGSTESSNQSDSDGTADSTGNAPNTASDTMPVAATPSSVSDDPRAPAVEDGIARPAGPQSIPPIQTSGTARAAVGTGKGAARIAPASP